MHVLQKLRRFQVRISPGPALLACQAAWDPALLWQRRGKRMLCLSSAVKSMTPLAIRIQRSVHNS